MTNPINPTLLALQIALRGPQGPASPVYPIGVWDMSPGEFGDAVPPQKALLGQQVRFLVSVGGRYRQQAADAGDLVEFINPLTIFVTKPSQPPYGAILTESNSAIMLENNSYLVID